MKYLIPLCFLFGCSQKNKLNGNENFIKIFNGKISKHDTCWLSFDKNLHYDTCILLNENRSMQFGVIASKKYGVNEQIVNQTQLIFAKKSANYWSICLIDTIRTTGDIDIWADSVNNFSTPRVFIKANVGNHGNLCAYLYQFNKSQNVFKKIIGFDSLPNATFSPNGQLISSLSVSGEYSLDFYQLTNDSLIKVNSIVAKDLDSVFFATMQNSVHLLNN